MKWFHYFILLTSFTSSVYSEKPIVVVLHEDNEALKKSWILESLRESFTVTFPKNDLQETLKDLSSRFPESHIFLTGVEKSASKVFEAGIECSKYLSAIAPIHGFLSKHIFPEKQLSLYYVADGSHQSRTTSLLPWLQILDINPFHIVSIKAKNIKMTIYGPNELGHQAVYVETDKKPEDLTHDIWQFFKIQK